MYYRISEFKSVLAVAAIGVAVAFTAFLLVRGFYYEQDRQQFRRDVTYYSANFKSDIAHHVNSLAAIHAFVSSSHDVNRWEFSNFAHQILPQNSGFKAVLWLPNVDHARRVHFEQGMQKDGLYGLTIRQLGKGGILLDAPQRRTYVPVEFVEPFEASGNLIGVDLSSDSTYGTLIETARKSRELAVSDPLQRVLIDSTDAPIIAAVFPLKTGEGLRRDGGPDEENKGYVLAILQLNEIIKHTLGPHPLIQLAVGTGGKALLYDPSKGSKSLPPDVWLGNSEFWHVEPFTIAGKKFSLAMRYPRNGSALTRLYVPLGIALLAITLTALLVQNMLGTILRKQKVEQAVVERTSELRQANNALQIEISERRSAEAQLRVAKDKAEAANRAKSSFLSTMSHELRTPLNAVIGFSGMLLNKQNEYDKVTIDYLRETNAGGNKLLELINDVLDITVMDTDTDLSNETIYVSELFEAVVEKSRSFAEASGVTVVNTLKDRELTIVGDARRLQKAVHNLVSNAIKFNKSGGSAQLNAVTVLNGVTLSVQDDGIGMPSDAQEQIATLFSQYDGSLARRHEGIGLGLTFVSRVAQHHDAELKISSQLGIGTLVQISFPRQSIKFSRRAA